MSQRVYRSINEEIRKGLSYDEKWKGSDRGLITCWEVGREMSYEKPDLAIRARNGELPVVGWKGGVGKELKKKEKIGTLSYLALWQGLRGEDLNIDLAEEPEIICSRTGVTVIFTGDVDKYGNTEG